MRDRKGLGRLVRSAMLALAAAALLGFAGCGEDGEAGEASAEAASGGLLFAQTTHAGTLEPIAGKDGVFELTLTDPAAGVTAFTDRPARHADTESLAQFVDRWDARGFAEIPPNAALVLDEEPDDADTVVFTISDPELDSASGELTYRATALEDERAGGLAGGADPDQLPSEFGNAHLFIDPASAGATPLYVQARMSSGGSIRLDFDSPWEVIVGTGDEGMGFVVGGSAGGLEVLPSQVKLTATDRGQTGFEFAVSGGSGAVTGTATVPSSAKATVQVGDGATVPLKSGKFSFGGS